VTFTEFFRDRATNHRQICLSLRELVDGVAAGFWFESAEQRNEVKQIVLLYAIERIDRFTFDRGDDAFTYYTSLLFHAILRQVETMKRQRARAALFTDVVELDGDGDEDLVELESASPYTRCSWHGQRRR
jgi:hypothetical protein